MLKLSIAAWLWVVSPMVSASTDSTGEPLVRPEIRPYFFFFLRIVAQGMANLHLFSLSYQHRHNL